MARVAALVLAASAHSWPALDAALLAYPARHAAALARLERGAPTKFVLVGAHHGLGNREHSLLSAFALALAADAALFVDWGAGQRCAGPRRRLRAKRGVCTAGTLDESYAAPGFAWTPSPWPAGGRGSRAHRSACARECASRTRRSASWSPRIWAMGAGTIP